MSTLEALGYKIQLIQYDSPMMEMWLSRSGERTLQISGSVNEFLVFVAWLNAESKRLKTQREMDEERVRKYGY